MTNGVCATLAKPDSRWKMPWDDAALHAASHCVDPPTSNWRALPWAIAVVAIAVAAWTFAHRHGSDAASREVLHLDIVYPPNVEPISGLQGGPSISPDGQSVAMIGLVRACGGCTFDDSTVRRLTEISNTTSASAASFSPDSKSVVFTPGQWVSHSNVAGRPPASGPGAGRRY